MAAPSKRIRPWLGCTRPMIDFKVVLLPTPLRPSSPTTSPGADVERDAVQDVALAVIGVQALDADQRLAADVGGGAHVLR